MNNDEILAELGTIINDLSKRLKDANEQIELLHMQDEKLRDIIAEYEGIQEPKKMYNNKGEFIGTVMPMSKLREGRIISRRKNCPHCGVEHTVRKDGGMYKHWVRKNGRIDLCPGIWMTN